MSILAKVKVQAKAIQMPMVAVVAKLMDRAIVILRMEGTDRALRHLAKGKASHKTRRGCIRASTQVNIPCLGGSIDVWSKGSMNESMNSSLKAIRTKVGSKIVGTGYRIHR